MKNIALCMIILGLLLTGCTTYYPEAKSSQPHATVEGEGNNPIPLVGMFSTPKAIIYEINGLPVNDWHKGYSDPRRVQPGPVSLFVRALLRSDLTAFAEINFNAEAGKRYIVTYDNNGEFITFRIYDAETNETVVTKEAAKTVERSPDPIFIPVVVP